MLEPCGVGGRVVGSAFWASKENALLSSQQDAYRGQIALNVGRGNTRGLNEKALLPDTWSARLSVRRPRNHITAYGRNSPPESSQTL